MRVRVRVLLLAAVTLAHVDSPNHGLADEAALDEPELVLRRR
jgi:hypothetical protein